ncbi:MAG TPA: aspartate aminotransferase family protein [Casimicrobiaceae bacterium]|nr:aspartate aminotransferase family protein [Casimicrobiaceae bacterium]
MDSQSQQSSLALWRADEAAHLLLVQPFMDSVIVRGEGAYLIDADGRRILDLAAGQFCTILGHGHPVFGERLAEQARRLVHLGDQFVSPEVLAAVARLVELAPPGLSKAILLSTGSEANECAMRIAKTVTERTGMLGFSRGYYGISLATHNLSSVADHPHKHDFQPSIAGQHKLLSPDPRRCRVCNASRACTLGCLDASMDLLGAQVDNIAAVIVEPVLSAGGMIFPPTEYLKALQAAARRHGFLFIVDEAQTGFGRCGRWFDSENHGIEPDIMVVSKTAGNGYPVAAVIVSEAVARRLEARRFMHLSSHQNDPLAAAAVLAVADVVEQEGLVENSRIVGDYFVAALNELKQRRPLVADVRGRGLMIGVELDPGESGSGLLAFTAAMLCEQRGLHLTFTYHEPVLRIIPPLVLTRADVDFAVRVLDDVLGILASGDHDLARLIPQNCRSGDFVRAMVKPSPAAFLRKVWRTSPEQWMRKLAPRRKPQ